MMPRQAPPPLYDRRRLEQLVMEYKMRVHLEQKKSSAHRTQRAGVKAPR